MGECRYYLKARFKNALAVEAPITQCLHELVAAYDWWQDHRDHPPAVFWPAFTAAFPVVSRYLDTLPQYARVLDGDCNNALSGTLSFRLDIDHDEDSLSFDATEMRYYATVWHLADWDRFAQFLLSEFDAEEVAWISEEDLTYDPFTLFPYPSEITST